MREQRLREAEALAKRHTVRKRLSLEPGPATLAPELFFPFIPLYFLSVLTEQLLCIVPCCSQGIVHTENSGKETARHI